MGRGVSVPSGAQVVAYDYVEFENEFDWDDLYEDALYRIQSIAPSMSADSGWAGREDQILASNGFAQFGLSEYCGVVAYWIIPEEGNGLAENWANRISAAFSKEFASMERVGVMSNGCSVYSKVS